MECWFVYFGEDIMFDGLFEDVSGVGWSGFSIVLVSVLVVTLLVPMGVSGLVDRTPDSSLYPLERMGERIRGGTFASGVDWEVELAEKRMDEFVRLVEEGEEDEYVELLEESDERVFNSLKSADDVDDFEKVEKTINYRNSVLEGVRNRASEVSEPAISFAVLSGERVREVVRDSRMGLLPRDERVERVQDLENELGTRRGRVSERIDAGEDLNYIVQDLELDVAEELVTSFATRAKERDEENYWDFLERSENRISVAMGRVRDSEGLERMRKGLENRSQVLDNLVENLPEEAQDRVIKHQVRNKHQERVLENIGEKMGREELPPGRVKQAIENKAIGMDNLENFLVEQELPPGILKNIVDNQEIPTEQVTSIIEEKDIPRGIIKNIVEDENIENNDFTGPPENVPGEGVGLSFEHERGQPDWAPGPPPWAGEGRQNGLDENEEVPEEVPEEDDPDDAEDENLEEGAFNLFENGVKLQDTPVDFVINPSNDQGLEEDMVVDEIGKSFEVWDDHSSTNIFSENFEVLENVSGFERDGKNLVSFDNLNSDSKVAETRIWIDENDESVLEFDIVLDSDEDWGILSEEDDEEVFDVRNIMTHEVGHTLVLEDVYDEEYSDHAMYYESVPGSTRKRTLGPGDIEGLQELYGE